ncbi:MAG: M90 family metallopeptidase [Burkholderiales bacterium]|jgi:Mlc titration factor MtfA (ptsG expression regulator)
MIWPLGPRRALTIDTDAWLGLQARLPYLRGLDADESERMRALIAAFLSAKTFTGAHGLEPDDSMRLVIAAQACLPVLNLGLAAYDDFVEVVVYPSAFAVRRRITDEDGLVHEFDDVLAGEAMDGGPIVLSWDDVDGSDRPGSANVVIHEFAHKLDLADGEADGCPPMPRTARARWLEALHAAYDDFVDALEAVEGAIPPDVDPESEAADDWYASLPLDPYAATDESEFFAVAAEAFFVDPEGFAEAFPTLHERFVEYFGRDPRRAAARAAD